MSYSIDGVEGSPRHSPILFLAVIAAGCYESSPLAEDQIDAFGSDMGDVADFYVEPVAEPEMDFGPEPELDSILEPELRPEPGPDPATETAPAGSVGDPCYSTSQCMGVPGAGRACLTSLMGYVSFPGGYCSAACTSDHECGTEGECVDVMGLGQYCLKRCFATGECRYTEGYECNTIPSGPSVTYCLPVGCCDPDS